MISSGDSRLRSVNWWRGYSAAGTSARARIFFGNDQFDAILFRQCLEPSCGIDGVTDRGQVACFVIAHFADDGRADVNADAKLERLRQLACERAAQLIEPRDHGARGKQCLAAPGRRVGLDAEQRHHAVSRVLIGDTARLRDRAADGLEVAVKYEDDVIGQLVFGHAREAAQIGEQHHNVDLLSVARAGEARAPCRR